MQKNTDNIDKYSDERNRMDVIDDREYDERDHIGESKEGGLESEESETDERDQIENTESIKMIYSQQNIENYDLVDTDI